MRQRRAPGINPLVELLQHPVDPFEEEQVLLLRVQLPPDLLVEVLAELLHYFATTLSLLGGFGLLLAALAGLRRLGGLQGLPIHDFPKFLAHGLDGPPPARQLLDLRVPLRDLDLALLALAEEHLQLHPLLPERRLHLNLLLDGSVLELGPVPLHLGLAPIRS